MVGARGPHRSSSPVVARRLVAAVGALLCVALLAGCVSSPPSTPSDPRSGGGLRYGLAPHPSQGVTFTKRVVLVQGGANSVRSVTADGLTWTLSPAAPGIGDLAPGRVMFLTDRAVGIVRAVQTDTAGVHVTLAPASLTDVIEKGTFRSAKPVPLEHPVVVSSAHSFWSDPELQKQAGAAPSVDDSFPENAVYRSSDASGPSVPRPPAAAAAVANAATTQSGGFAVKESCCAAGPALKLAYNKDGLKMFGSAQLMMQTPKVDFYLELNEAKVEFCRLLIHGGHLGVDAHLDAATEPNKVIAGYSPPLGADVSFSVPLGTYGGVPLSMTVTQTLGVRINIPGTAALHVTGKLDLGATLGFRYRDGKWENLSAGRFDADSALKGTNSIAVGISYATFDYVIRLTVGIGYGGFTAGPFFALGASFSGIVGAPIGINIDPGAQDAVERCRTIKGSLSYQVGVGFTIPAFVKKVVDFVLRVFNRSPIPRAGGPHTAWRSLASVNVTRPQSGFCVKK